MERLPRVLLLFPHYNTINESSSLRSPQIAWYLVSKGYDVTVIAPGVDIRTGKALPQMDGRLLADSVEAGVRVIRPKCIEDFRRSMLRRLFFECHFAAQVGYLFFHLPRPDLVIGAYPPAVLPYVGLLFCKIRRIPFIFEVRDLMADALAANQYSRSRLLNLIARIFENTTYRLSDHIITVSDGIKRILTEKRVPATKITPVKNGYEPQVFEQADFSINARKEFGWSDKFVVIYTGGLTQSYDIPTLLEAAKKARDIEDILFVLIGEGNRKQQYIKYCKDNQLHNVQIRDVVPRKMIPAVLQAANVGVHLFPDNPLWSYVLGNKPFDYLGSALPMIYAGTGDTAELVTMSGAGFVVHPERPSELLDKIVWLKNNPSEAKIMGLKGKAFVVTECNRLTLLETLDSVLSVFINREKSK